MAAVLYSKHDDQELPWQCNQSSWLLPGGHRPHTRLVRVKTGLPWEQGGVKKAL